VFSLVRAAHSAPALILGTAFFLAASSTAQAQSTTHLSGLVTNAQNAPVAAAAVLATGSNLVLRTKTDSHGTFTFPAVPPGTYNVDITAPEGHASLRVDLTSAGTTITVALTQVKEIGRTAVTSRPPAQGSGTDVSLSAENLTRSPANGNLSELLVQLPGAARGANGVVHINGDHGDINYIVDGVPIPQELNRTVGGEFDSNNLAFVEALQGAYPAQYGERFASVININTRNGNGPAGFTGDVQGGSYSYLDSTLGYHAPIGTGNIDLAVRNERGDRGLDPPGFDSPHNDYSNANQFLRYTQPLGTDFLNLTVSRSYRTYQIPTDRAGGEPASTDDNQTQEDLFSALQIRHPISDHGSLSFGPFYKRSRIRDFGDPENDFAYGEAQNPGLPTDCANALSPTVSYTNATCGVSLFSDRTAIDVGANLDYQNRSDKHTVAFGALYDATHVSKTYAITLQPGNFLAPIFTPGAPDAPYTVVDNAPNVGHLSVVYLQNSWRMGSAWQLDIGARGDSFTVFSTQFSDGFGQISPRVKLTRSFGPRANVYAYYGRFFTPFSLENVSPAASFTLNLPLQKSVAAFDLKPQRDSDYEIGGHFGVGPGDLGVRVMQKDATDLIDDTQIGTTDLHQDINYREGRIASQTAYYQLPLARSGRFYASATHTYSVNKGCETQLLAPCFGQSDDWTPADHDQRWDVTSGVLANDRHNGWLALDGEYGSGLSAGLNPTGGITCAGPAGNSGGPCKRTPHLTFDAEKGVGLAHGMALTLRVGNIFNDRYYVTFLNAQGNHIARPRTFDLGLRFNTR
jgi:hypothetical protein